MTSPEKEKRVTTKPRVRSVGGFDVPPCALCSREVPCECGGRRNCACTCGRCLYPYPLPDDGPLPEARTP